MSNANPMRRYRRVPSEDAGYAPGLSVVQYYDPATDVWFDCGDPKSYGAALEEVDRRSRQSFLVAELEGVLLPDTAADPSYRLKITSQRGQTKWLSVDRAVIVALIATMGDADV